QWLGVVHWPLGEILQSLTAKNFAWQWPTIVTWGSIEQSITTQYAAAPAYAQEMLNSAASMRWGAIVLAGAAMLGLVWQVMRARTADKTFIARASEGMGSGLMFGAGGMTLLFALIGLVVVLF